MRKAILKAADEGLIKSLCECAHNTLKGNVRLNSKQKSKLRRHKNVLRNIIKRGENWRKKQKLLVQRGGAIIPLLLAPILSGIIGSLLQ